MGMGLAGGCCCDIVWVVRAQPHVIKNRVGCMVGGAEEGQVLEFKDKDKRYLWEEELFVFVYSVTRHESKALSKCRLQVYITLFKICTKDGGVWLIIVPHRVAEPAIQYASWIVNLLTHAIEKQGLNCSLDLRSKTSHGIQTTPKLQNSSQIFMTTYFLRIQ